MTEEQAVEEIRSAWPDEQVMASPAATERLRHALSIASVALDDHPQSAMLWVLLGELVEIRNIHAHLHGGWPAIPTARPVDCYTRALQLDPTHVDALVCLADVYDNILDRPAEALPLYTQAFVLGAGRESIMGRARTLAELGRKDEAIDALSSAVDPAERDEEMDELLDEIATGMWDPFE